MLTDKTFQRYDIILVPPLCITAPPLTSSPNTIVRRIAAHFVHRQMNEKKTPRYS